MTYYHLYYMLYIICVIQPGIRPNMQSQQLLHTTLLIARTLVISACSLKNIISKILKSGKSKTQKPGKSRKSRKQFSEFCHFQVFDFALQPKQETRIQKPREKISEIYEASKFLIWPFVYQIYNNSWLRLTQCLIMICGWTTLTSQHLLENDHKWQQICQIRHEN